MVLLGGTVLPVAAAESYGTFDPLDTPLLKPGKWITRERTRVLEGNALHLIQRDVGDQVDNVGIFQNSYAVDMVNPSVVTQIQASVTVNAFDVTGCASNTTTPSDVQARLIGSFFNTGPVTAGSRVNDILGLVRLIRYSDSADAAGVLRAEGLMVRCTSSDCANSTLVGSISDLGAVDIGTQVTLRIMWDSAANKFFYRLNNTTVSASYAISDGLPPQVAFKQIGNRTRLANCQGNPPTTGLMDATFDSVYVNASAVP